MADLSELLKSKKVSEFVRQGKSRPWTVDLTSTEPNSEPVNPVKTESKPGENPVKTESKPGENPVKPIYPERLKIDEPGENPVTNPVKNIDEPGENPVKTRGKKRDHLYISGQDRKVMLALFSLASEDGFKQTPPFSKQTLSKRIPLSYETLRSSLKRLRMFGVLESVESARGGPSAWTRATFTEDAYRSLYLTRLKPGENPVTDAPQTRLKPGDQPGETRSSSSSFLTLENIKTTTTSEPELFDDGRVQLSPEWLAVAPAPLAEIGFTQTHVMQLAKHSKLSASEVGASIEFFAFDLRRNGKAKAINGSPLNFFMGIVRKGIPYAPPENFETAADEARRRTREILERKERERLADEQRLKDLEFAEWRRGITEDQATALVPDPVKDIPRAREASLQNHFNEKVWPELEAARIGVSESERQQIRAAIAQSLGEVQV